MFDVKIFWSAWCYDVMHCAAAMWAADCMNEQVYKFFLIKCTKSENEL